MKKKKKKKKSNNKCKMKLNENYKSKKVSPEKVKFEKRREGIQINKRQFGNNEFFMC